MSILNKGFDSEKLSGIAASLSSNIDNTAYSLFGPIGLETAGAANTAASIVDLSKWSENTVYVNCTNGPAGNAGTTGLTVIFETRPASAIGWVVFRTETGVQTTGLSAFKIVGSGVAALSGVTHFKDVKITVQNTTDSSGTATVQAWLLQRTPI
jgi:hypothetical protein